MPLPSKQRACACGGSDLALYVHARLATTLVLPRESHLSQHRRHDPCRVHGANYAITRHWSLACNPSHEYRLVTGGLVSYVSNDNMIGCSTQYNLHL